MTLSIEVPLTLIIAQILNLFVILFYEEMGILMMKSEKIKEASQGGISPGPTSLQNQVKEDLITNGTVGPTRMVASYDQMEHLW
jgi:hypothetical protein